METHSPSLPPLHSGDKKIRPSSYQNSLLQGMNNIDFLFMGDTHIRHNIVFFRSACRCAQLVLRLSPPPTGRLCARPVGGGPVRRLLYCGLPAAGRVGRAIWSFDFLLENFRRPVSLQDVYMRAFM
jgi:hypothetical protein